MEERRGPRRLTQQQLGDLTAEPEVPPVDVPGDAPGAPGGAADEGRDSPSGAHPPPDLLLRERQRRWWQERARFEAAKKARRGSDDPTPRPDP